MKDSVDRCSDVRLDIEHWDALTNLIVLLWRRTLFVCTYLAKEEARIVSIQVMAYLFNVEQE